MKGMIWMIEWLIKKDGEVGPDYLQGRGMTVASNTPTQAKLNRLPLLGWSEKPWDAPTTAKTKERLQLFWSWAL